MNPRKTILVVEDDHSIRTVLCEILQTEGYHVLSATNGKDALQILEGTEKPMLIFLDIMMPEMNGYEFLEVLGKSVLAPIPVVVTSATADPKKLGEGHRFLKKPLDMYAVLKIAEEYCGAGA